MVASLIMVNRAAVRNDRTVRKGKNEKPHPVLKMSE
jgi:hypothetical protein